MVGAQWSTYKTPYTIRTKTLITHEYKECVFGFHWSHNSAADPPLAANMTATDTGDRPALMPFITHRSSQGRPPLPYASATFLRRRTPSTTLEIAKVQQKRWTNTEVGIEQCGMQEAKPNACAHGPLQVSRSHPIGWNKQTWWLCQNIVSHCTGALHQLRTHNVSCTSPLHAALDAVNGHGRS
jgi:hypothetical protein